jgi:hypothetical protein
MTSAAGGTIKSAVLGQIALINKLMSWMVFGSYNIVRAVGCSILSATTKVHLDIGQNYPKQNRYMNKSQSGMTSRLLFKISSGEPLVQ